MLTKRKAQGLAILSIAFVFAIVFGVRDIVPWLVSNHEWYQRQGISFKTNQTVQVSRVVDGDTIVLADGRKVRYIGINTPETVDPRRPVQCFGTEASAFNHTLVAGKTVRLEKDISETDKYGRLLRFVYLEDGTLVNETLVREGYASASAFPPDITKQDLFFAAEREARAAHAGLWNPETCDGKK